MNYTITKPVIFPKWIQVCINQLLNLFTTFLDEKQQKFVKISKFSGKIKQNISYSLILAAHVNTTRGMCPIAYGSTNQDRFSIPCGQSHSTMVLGTRLRGSILILSVPVFLRVMWTASSAGPSLGTVQCNCNLYRPVAVISLPGNAWWDIEIWEAKGLPDRVSKVCKFSRNSANVYSQTGCSLASNIAILSHNIAILIGRFLSANCNRREQIASWKFTKDL
jgi:hypothetical protein